MDFFGNNLSDEELSLKKQQEDQAAEASRYERLKRRFNDDQPWFVRNAHWRSKAEFFSYVANITSCLGLSYATIIMLDFIPIPYVNYILAIVLLFSFEYLKRKFSDLFWDIYHSTGAIDWKSGLTNFVVLFGLSLAGTGYGVWFYAQDNDPGAAALREELAKVEESIKTHENNKKGDVIYWNSQEILQGKEGSVGLYAERDLIKDKIGKIEGEQIVTTEDTGYVYEKANFRKYGSLLLAILLEIVFEICMSFMSKYDYHKFKLAELAMKQKQGAGIPPSQVSILNNLQAENDMLRAQLANTQSTQLNGNSFGTNNYKGEGMQIRMPWVAGLDTVATGSNRVATAKLGASDEVDQLNRDRLTLALKNAKSNLSAWASKLKNGKGTRETAERNIQKWNGIVESIESEIAACTA